MLNVVSRIDNTRQPYLYRGEDCMKQFVQKRTEIKKDMFEKMSVNKPMDELTYEQKIEFRNATNCSICGKNFSRRRYKSSRPLPLHRQIQRRSACKNVIWIIH